MQPMVRETSLIRLLMFYIKTKFKAHSVAVCLACTEIDLVLFLCVFFFFLNCLDFV